MPVFKNRLVLNISKDLRAFLNVDGGLIRGGLPGEEFTAEAVGRESAGQGQAPRRAPRGAPGKPSGGTARPPSPEEEARSYVAGAYGYEQGPPGVGLLDVLPGLDETVSVDTSSAAQTPADTVLLKGLAAGLPGCRALQIGSSWRSRAAANVARAAGECTSVIAEVLAGGDERREGLLAERAVYGGDPAEVSYGSRSFDHESSGSSFDLIFLNGLGTRELAEAATRAAFDLLKDAPGSTVVWSACRPGSAEIDWQVLAGILDGLPGNSPGNLYRVSGTSQLLWTRRDIPEEQDPAGRSGGEVLDVRFSAGTAARNLVLLDDGFPSRRSAFRIAEYNNYLERWGNATLYSTATSFKALGEKGDFGEVLAEYAGLYPDLGSRVFEFRRDLDLGGDLAYFIFLSNALRFLTNIEESGSPFAFTLYPGGGFKLGQEDSDERLRRVCSSPSFRKVIATQKVTHEYLLDGGFCSPEEVEFVYGGVFPFSNVADHAMPRRYYKKDKDTFDVCFVAYKYTQRSIESKGYDVFAEVARRLAGTHPDMVFHVVGTFDENDADFGGAGDRVRFHGPMNTEAFPAFYSGMDAIVSPNAPFVLQPGAFDGFPTGSCMEAGMCGTAVFCSDPLDQNVAFEDGEEMVIIPRDAGEICASLSYYRDHYEHLRLLADRGQRAFARVFDIEAQMKPRLQILSELLGEPGAGRETGGRVGQHGRL